MAAADVLNPGMPSGSHGAAAAFSPITLFECTISNASMLVDSMPVRDLMTAVRLVSQLNAHLVEVMDPQVNRLVDTTDGGAPQQQQQHSLGNSSGHNNHQHLHHPHQTPRMKQQLDYKSSVAAASDLEDLQNMEEDFNPENSDLIGGVGRSSLLVSPSPGSVKRSRPPADMAMSGELSTEWKGILRKAYRELKDENNSDVFDFSLPYSAQVNRSAASLVIERARHMTNFTPNNLNSWTKLAEKYTKLYYLGTLRKMHRERHRPETGKFDHLFKVMFKLNRRQKAYETLKSSLDAGSRSRFEAVLNRDYTSSDEESPTEPDGQPRVKQLTWESEELRGMKMKLDDVYYGSLADEKQRAEVDRVLRDGRVKSSRPAPSDGLDWAKCETE